MTARKGDDPNVVNISRKKSAPKTSSGWREKLIQNDKGAPKACVANAICALRYAPEWDAVLWHDEFAIRTVIRRPTPWMEPSLDTADVEWTDADDIRLADWLQHQDIAVTPAVAGQAVEVAARIYPFHPVREYLDSLQWDGKRRISYWLRDYLGVQETIYSKAVAERWLVSAVARIYRPGCKADCALILEGPQGLKKSTALSVLGGEWFTDQMADMGNKDSCVDVQGAWIMELSELDTMRRGDIATIKAFMSRPADRFRMPYGRRTAKFHRQCVFAGTINPEGGGYLKDPTGGRRFWPVKCTRIDADALKADVDQIWAEAVEMFRLGAPWWLDTPELERLAEEEQSERYQGDAWDGLIQQYLTHYKVPVTNANGIVTGQRWVERSDPLTEITIAEVLTDVLEIEKSRWTKADQMRIGGALTAMHFERYRWKGKGHREYRYRRLGPTSQGEAQGRAQGRAQENVNETNDLDPSGPTCPTCPTFSETCGDDDGKSAVSLQVLETGGVGGAGRARASNPLKCNGDFGPHLDTQGRAPDKVGPVGAIDVIEHAPEDWGL